MSDLTIFRVEFQPSEKRTRSSLSFELFNQVKLELDSVSTRLDSVIPLHMAKPIWQYLLEEFPPLKTLKSVFKIKIDV